MSRSFSKKVLSLALLAFSSSVFAGDYELDMTHSSVTFNIKHLGISNVKGEFKNFTGAYTLDPKGNLTKLTGDVVVSSINTGVEKRDNHLRSADFFEAEKFPKITFVMTKSALSNKKGSITGNLTMHGITKPVTLKTVVAGPVNDPFGNTKSSVSLEGSIKRKDFGLTWNKAMEAGGFVVGEDVKITIDLEGNEK